MRLFSYEVSLIYSTVKVQLVLGQNCFMQWLYACRQTSNIRRTLVGNKLVDHSDVTTKPLK